MYPRRLWIIILLRCSKEKRQADETMDGQRNGQTGLIGRQAERKKDDCGINYRQFKAESQEMLAVVANGNVAVV